MADKPVTREEKYLAYLTGDYKGEIPKPITRKEKYLYELCLKEIGGEISPEEIKNAVNEYLEKNPVKPGATTEQAQQIEQNKTDVASLKEETGSLKEDLSDVNVKSETDTSDVLHVTDGNGNIICTIDKDGVHSVGFNGKNLALNDVLCTYEDKFYITDASGNVIFKADKDGISGVNITGGSSGQYKGMKLISIGDSLSAHDKWQKWVCEWTGMYFDNDENINGANGYAPMAKGGTAVIPNATDSIYIRALDAVNYLDTEKGTVIFIYAGQNDIPHFGDATDVVSARFGTINDVPYLKDVPYTELAESEWSDYTSWGQGRPTTYSSCMGLIQKLQTSCPSAIIKIITPMQMWVSNTQSVSRKALDTLWKEIGAKYGCKVISLWEDSGVSMYNASYYYDSVENVHPSIDGYKNGVARTICAEI